MRRTPGPDEICALCDEYTRKPVGAVAPAEGTGLCLASEQGRPIRHVEWNGRTCVGFRLDRQNLAARRQYVTLQRRAAATTEGEEP